VYISGMTESIPWELTPRNMIREKGRDLLDSDEGNCKQQPVEVRERKTGIVPEGYVKKSSPCSPGEGRPFTGRV